MSAPDQILGHRTEPEGSREAVAADDDQVRSLTFGDAQERLRRAPHRHAGPESEVSLSAAFFGGGSAVAMVRLMMGQKPARAEAPRSGR